MKNIKQILNKIGQVVWPHNTMYDRLDLLFDYFRYCDLSSEKIHIHEIDMKTQDKFVHFFFFSSLGEVDIFFMRYSIGCTRFSLKYVHYTGAYYFEIDSAEDENEVIPMLGEDLFAEQIDLSILELEEYIRSLNIDIQKIKKEYWDNKDRKFMLHKQELRKLL